MQVIGDFARKIKVPTPMFDATQRVYVEAMKTGYGSHDTAAVCAVLEKAAKVKRRAQRAWASADQRPACTDSSICAARARPARAVFVCARIGTRSRACATHLARLPLPRF